MSERDRAVPGHKQAIIAVDPPATARPARRTAPDAGFLVQLLLVAGPDRRLTRWRPKAAEIAARYRAAAALGR